MRCFVALSKRLFEKLFLTPVVGMNPPVLSPLTVGKQRRAGAAKSPFLRGTKNPVPPCLVQLMRREPPRGCIRCLRGLGGFSRV